MFSKACSTARPPTALSRGEAQDGGGPSAWKPHSFPCECMCARHMPAGQEALAGHVGYSRAGP